MSINGFSQLRKHVPGFNSPIGVLRILFLPILLFFLVTASLNSQALTRSLWPLVGEILFGSLGFFSVYLFTRYKNDFKARYGPLAYSKAVSWFGFPGVSIIAAVVAHIRDLPGPGIPHFWWYFLLSMVGWALIVVGLVLFLRTLQTFGLDYLIMLYVYFPEESQLVDHKIYKILRHPAYAAAQPIAFGLALLNGGWFALASALIFALGLWGWVRLVEEKELIERFGQSYIEYRQRVPAFWPHLGDLKEFFEFLVLGR